MYCFKDAGLLGIISSLPLIRQKISSFSHCKTRPPQIIHFSCLILSHIGSLVSYYLTWVHLSHIISHRFTCLMLSRMGSLVSYYLAWVHLSHIIWHGFTCLILSDMGSLVSYYLAWVHLSLQWYKQIQTTSNLLTISHPVGSDDVACYQRPPYTQFILHDTCYIF